MIKLRFYSDINFNGFVEDVQGQLGQVPGAVDENARTVTLSMQEFYQHEEDLRELLRDYGGQLMHVAGI